MQRKRLAKHILLLAGIALFVVAVACAEEPDCTDARRRMVYCELMTTNDNGEAVKYTLPYVKVWIKRDELPDSTLLNGASNQTSLALPLRFTKEETVWILSYNANNLNIGNDTVRIHHQNTPVFVSLACGYTMKQHISDDIVTTTAGINKIEIVSPETNQDGKTNLRIFY